MTQDHARSTYERLCTHTREVAILNSTQSLLGWDERTKLPPAGGEYRAEQMSYLAGFIHKKQTAPEVGEWLAELADSALAADPHSEAGADIVNLKRDYDRKTKLPQALVEELAKLSVLGAAVVGRSPQGERLRAISAAARANARAQAARGGRNRLREGTVRRAAR